MMPIDSENTGETSRLQRPKLKLKIFKVEYFSIKFGLCNLGFPYTFLESTVVLQQYYALGFLGRNPIGGSSVCCNENDKFNAAAANE